MIEEVRRTLENECRLRPDDRFILGVSGGADSRCLLQVCVDLGYAPIVAHLDHGIRAGSGTEAHFVRELAMESGLEFVTERVSVPSFAAERRLSMEAAARFVRYEFLFRKAEALGGTAVMVAHSADDQVETILLHILRGSGMAGLRGMQPWTILPQWHASIPLIRPMLGVWAAEIRAYCTEGGLAWIEDPSNLDLGLLRNRVRHDLIPFLETYNPAFRKALLRLAAAAGGDLLLAERAYLSIEKDLILQKGRGSVLVDRSALLEHEPAVQRSLVFRILADLTDRSTVPEQAVVRRAVEFFYDASKPAQQDLGNGLRQTRKDGNILIAWKESLDTIEGMWPQLWSSESIPVPVPGYVELPNGWCLTCMAMSEAEKGAAVSPVGFTMEVDADRIVGELILRPRRTGDRIKPLGMDGHSQKVSDVMINAKLPRRARKAWPLLALGDEIVWIPGYRLAHPFRITLETRRVLRFVMNRKKVIDT